MSAHPVVLSYGMGADSTALLLRWIHEPDTRPCDLTELLVVTAMTGDEWPVTGRLVTEHVLPLLRRHGIRYAQIARASAHQEHGITVLDDSRNPAAVHLAGDYRPVRRAGRGRDGAPGGRQPQMQRQGQRMGPGSVPGHRDRGPALPARDRVRGGRGRPARRYLQHAGPHRLVPADRVGLGPRRVRAVHPGQDRGHMAEVRHARTARSRCAPQADGRGYWTPTQPSRRPASRRWS